MSDEHDSWIKSALGVDVGEALSKVKDEAVATFEQVTGGAAPPVDPSAEQGTQLLPAITNQILAPGAVPPQVSNDSGNTATPAEPSTGQPAPSTELKSGSRTAADGTVTLAEATIVGDANFARAYDLGLADGRAGAPTHRPEIEALAPGPTELLANYDQGFRDGQSKPRDDDDGLPPGNPAEPSTTPEDEPWRGERPMTAAERSQAQTVYQDSIDYDKVVLAAGSLGSTGSTRTIANTICMEDDEFQPHSSALSAEGMNTMIHELGHVWQYQHGGLEYIPSALGAQAVAYVLTGDRDDAYDWRRAIKAGIDWKDWNAEQQARAMEEFYIADQRIKAAKVAGTAPSLADDQTVKTLEPFVSKVQSGKGAPGGPSDEPGDFVAPEGGDSATG